MRARLLLFFIVLGIRFQAQDRIYLQDGSCVVAKVLEIGPDDITVVPISESGAPFRNADEKIAKPEIVLIEYKNGSVEYLNSPRKSVVSDDNNSRAKSRKAASDKIVYHNLISINSLALMNSDIAGFFEHLSDNSKIGLGVMAAYNFNKYASLQNNFISILNASKKQYDLGAFLNFYPSGFKRRSTFFMGLMMKYTAFTYSGVTEINSSGQVSYKYTRARGSQLATLVTLGIQTNLTKTVFIKTFMGLGAFNLRGDYRKQYNYQLNIAQNSSKGASSTTSTNYNIGTLPKLYFGINIGYNF